MLSDELAHLSEVYSVIAGACWSCIGQVGMTSLQVNWSLAEVNASVFMAVF